MPPVLPGECYYDDPMCGEYGGSSGGNAPPSPQKKLKTLINRLKTCPQAAKIANSLEQMQVAGKLKLANLGEADGSTSMFGTITIDSNNGITTHNLMHEWWHVIQRDAYLSTGQGQPVPAGMGVMFGQALWVGALDVNMIDSYFQRSRARLGFLDQEAEDFGQGIGNSKVMVMWKRIATLGLALMFGLSLLWLTFFAPEVSRVRLNHWRAAHNIRALVRAQQSYAATNKKGEFACNLLALAAQGTETSKAIVANQLLTSGKFASYEFRLKCPDESTDKATGYAITAVPEKPGVSGNYAFCTDQKGVIWYSNGGLATDCLAGHKPLESQFE